MEAKVTDVTPLAKVTQVLLKGVFLEHDASDRTS